MKYASSRVSTCLSLLLFGSIEPSSARSLAPAAIAGTREAHASAGYAPEDSTVPSTQELERTLARARALFDESRYEACERLLRGALDAWVGETPESSKILEGYELLVACLYARGDLVEARKIQETLLEIRLEKAGGDQFPPEAADDLYNLGHLAERLRDYAAADSAWSALLTLLRESRDPDHEQVASCLSDLGEVSRIRGSYDRAESLMVAALRESEGRLVPLHLRAVFLNNLGLLYWDQGRLDEAERLIREGLRVTETDTAASALRMMRAHENLGVLLRDQDKLKGAEEELHRALEIGTTGLGPEDPALATVLDALGTLYSRREDGPKAVGFWRRALHILESQSYPPEHYRATILDNLGNGLLEEGDAAGAREAFEECLAIRERLLPRDHAELGIALTGLARVEFTAGGDTTQARELIDRAVPILEAASVAPEVLAEALALRARMEMSAGRPEPAFVDLGSALGIVEELRPRRGGGDETRARFLARYAEYYSQMIAWLVAAARTEEAFQLSERVRARVLLEQIASGHIDMRRGIPRAELEPLERRERDARTRINQLRNRLNVLKSNPTPLTPEQTRELGDLEVQLLSASREFGEAADLIRLASPAWRELLVTRNKPPGLSELQDRLVGPGQLLLAYQVGPQGCFLFSLGPAPSSLDCYVLEIPRSTDRPAGVDPGPLTAPRLAHLLLGGEAWRGQQGFAEWMQDLRGRPIQDIPGESGINDDAAERLELIKETLLPDPVWQQVLAARTVLIIPDGVLHLLPFEALVTSPPSEGEGPRFWLDDGPPIRYGHSLTLLRELADREPMDEARNRLDLLSVSDPHFVSLPGGSSAVSGNSTFPSMVGSGSPPDSANLRGTYLTPLPGSATESEAIARCFDSRKVFVLQGAEATEGRVKELAPGARYVHLATHGLVSEESGGLLAALAFTPPPPESPAGEEDGFLHLFEVYEMSLNAELAVLSACSTHLGRRIDGEGVFALSRGFLAAGARRVVASLWPVSDASTATLMSKFFKEIARSPGPDESPDYATALFEAKRSLRRDPRWSSPFFWAPFVLTGAP